MKSRVDACQELLEKGDVIKNVLTYANGLHMNLQTFSDSVSGIMKHLSVSRFYKL